MFGVSRALQVKWQDVPSLIMMWFAHALVAVVLSAPVVILGRHRVQWRFSDVLALVLPFAVWILLTLAHYRLFKMPSGKHPAEIWFISLAIALAALMRVMIGRLFRESRTSACLVLALCVVAAAFYFLMPPIPR